MDVENTWFVIINEEKVGPMSLAELFGLFMEGTVNGESFIWRSDYSDWKPANEVHELQALLVNLEPKITGEEVTVRDGDLAQPIAQLKSEVKAQDANVPELSASIEPKLTGKEVIAPDGDLAQPSTQVKSEGTGSNAKIPDLSALKEQFIQRVEIVKTGIVDFTNDLKELNKRIAASSSNEEKKATGLWFWERQKKAIIISFVILCLAMAGSAGSDGKKNSGTKNKKYVVSEMKAYRVIKGCCEGVGFWSDQHGSCLIDRQREVDAYLACADGMYINRGGTLDKVYPKYRRVVR